ncbi:MAG: response regulator transcription factor [Halieaceae bacterium]|jgi:DNA-binding response OmpR family regulator|nr:response regulator transcription factor [Halieaceae bacterium]
MVEREAGHPITILVLEDDPDTLEEVSDTLEEVSETLSDEGFVVLCASSARQLRELVKRNSIDLFLMDLKLPDEDGLDLVRTMRTQSAVGIIIVSGKAGEIDRVVGLEVGADDYIAKPFSPRELVARVRTVLRRTKGSTYPDASHDSSAREVVEFSGWALDLAAHHLIAPSGEGVDLTTAEFELLRAFVESAHRILSRDYLLDRVHGQDWAGYDRGIDGLVSRLRRKLKQAPGAAPFIKTIRGAGYLFTADIVLR